MVTRNDNVDLRASLADILWYVFWTVASAWMSLSRLHTGKVGRPSAWPNGTSSWPFDWRLYCKCRRRKACRRCGYACVGVECSGSWRFSCRPRRRVWCWRWRCSWSSGGWGIGWCLGGCVLSVVRCLPFGMVTAIRIMMVIQNLDLILFRSYRNFNIKHNNKD